MIIAYVSIGFFGLSMELSIGMYTCKCAYGYVKLIDACMVMLMMCGDEGEKGVDEGP